MQTRRRMMLGTAATFATPILEAREAMMEFDPKWEFISDGVMGGVSTGSVNQEAVQGRRSARLQGTVSLENNGGFVQMAFDILPDGGIFDASGFTGIAFDSIGNDEVYDLRLRTDELRRPWHSYRTEFTAAAMWKTHRIPFSQILPHRTEIPFDPSRLRRIGILAIGRVFEADISVSRISLY